MVNTPSSDWRRRCLASTTLICALPVIAQASDWRITPSISVSERYTDNVTLGLGGNNQSSFITDVTPGIALSRQGARARVAVNYSLHGLLYSHDGDANDIQHQLNATLSAEPINEVFFLEGAARIGQSAISSSGRIGGDYSLGGNRVETRSIGITPILRKRFGNTATAEARWALTMANSDGGALSTSRGDNLSLSLSSGPSFNRLPWSLALTRRNMDNSNTSSEITGLNGYLGYRISPKLELGASLGYDDHAGSSNFNQRGGSHGNVSLHWAPTTRTSLGASAGQRYNGNSYSLDALHRTAQTTWSLRYSESITDPGDLLLSVDQYLCLVGNNQLEDRYVPSGEPAPGNCLLIARADVSARDLGLLADPTLTKSWTGAVTYRLSKSTFTLSLNNSQRELLGAAGGVDEHVNIRASWNWRIGPRTTSVLSLAQGSSESSTVATDSDNTTLTWMLTRKLAPKTSGSVEIRRQQRGGGTSGDYDENTVAARVTHQF